MTDELSTSPIGKKYAAVLAIAVLLSWLLHELAHWSAGEYLGYEMGMTLNSCFPVAGQYSNESHYHIISAAGPIFTLLEAIIIFVVMKRRKVVLLYPFLFTCFYMRLFALVISVRRANDEARISNALGIGKFTLPFLVVIPLFFLVYNISKEYKLGARFNLITLVLTILFSSIIILADMYFKVRLI